MLAMSPLTFYCRACLVDFIFDDKSISSMTARYHSGRREELLAATLRLVEQLGGRVVGVAFMIELAFLHGRDKLRNYPLHSLIVYD